MKKVLLTITMLSFACSGCSLFLLPFSDWETSYNVVGSYRDYNVVFSGIIKAKPLKGISKINVKGVNVDAQGEGSSWITYIPPTGSCEGQKGEFLMTFDDDRVVKGSFIVTSCSSGWGSGADQDGNVYSFKFGIKKKDLQNEINKLIKNSSNKPDLPTIKNQKKINTNLSKL